MTTGPRLYRLAFATALRHVDAERAHHAALGALRAATAPPGAAAAARRLLGPESAGPPVRALGMDFPGRLGLAAGFDKNAEGITALAALGFAFIEVGTVTAHPQPGNPHPRMFRLPRDRAIVNRMGFNNDGAAAVAARLRRLRAAGRGPAILGVNIGRTKAVPAEAAVPDYTASARRFAPLADYLVVNVSSPNTPGLRDLQAADRLAPLLTEVRSELDRSGGSAVPLVVKIAPDLADRDIDVVADLALQTGLHGIIATNTTSGRPGLATPPEDVRRVGAGGLSGAPLRPRACAVLRRLRERLGTALTLIAAGGIETPEDAAERIAAGATLVQAYTGLVYGGPLWPRRMNRALAGMGASGDQVTS